MFFLRFFVILVCAVVAGVCGAQAAVPKPEKVQIHLIPAVQAVAPGQPFTLVIEQLIDPGWHTYWTNPGDSGTPTRATWTLPPGSVVGPLMFPTPERIPYGPLMNFGYSNRALYTVQITPPAAFTDPRFPVRVALEWLVCKDICIPEGDVYTLDLPVAAKGRVNEDAADVIHDATLTHPVSVNWPVTYAEEGGNFVVTVLPGGQGAQWVMEGARVAYFPREWGLFQNPAEQVLVKTDEADGHIMLVIPRDTRPLAEVKDFSGVLTLTTPEGDVRGFDVMASLAGVAPTKTPPPSVPKSERPARDLPTDMTVWTAIMLAILGGLILNLMPCVFPVLSLKVLSLTHLNASTGGTARAHGVGYLIGVVGTFLVFAGLLMSLQQAGQAIGWGFQLQQPLVVVGLVYLFFVLGVSLMGGLSIDLVRFLPAARQGEPSTGVIGSVMTGVLATLVATPCTAPFMGAAMGYALMQSPLIGLLVFAALGFGLALPFVLFCFLPRLRRVLPRPGAWMETCKQFFAFPMWLTGIWLLWVLVQQTGPSGLAAALVGLLLISFLIWLTHQTTRGIGWYLAVLAALIGVVLATTQVRGTPPGAQMAEQGFSPVALDRALQGNAPVFVNMTAAWCITCKVNEQAVLHRDAVQTLFAERGVVYLKGDWTNYDADITDYLARFDRSGVPLYIYYGPRDAKTGARPDPVVLPQILTLSILEQTLTQKE